MKEKKIPLKTEILEEEIQPIPKKFPIKDKSYEVNLNLLHKKQDFSIFLSNKVYEQIYSLALFNQDVEIAGILVGDYYIDINNEQKFIIIENYILAETERASPVHFEFNEKTWEKIDIIFEKKYKYKKMLGWFHSHPGLDIFLSDLDIFIHRNFFSNSWQVVYVIDTKNNKAGFFIWSGGEIQLAPAFYIYSFGKKIKKSFNLANFSCWRLVC